MFASLIESVKGNDENWNPVIMMNFGENLTSFLHASFTAIVQRALNFPRFIALDTE